MYFFKEALVTIMSMLSGSISQQLLDKNSDLRKAIDSMLHDVTLFDPEFVLNQPQYKSGTILVAGPEFGTGSSREHAVWALQNYGFKVVISSRFADIFRGNSLKGGLLTVILPQEAVEAIWTTIESDPTTSITVDLETRTVSYGSTTVAFELDDYTRWRLMEGLDDIGLTLKHTDAIDSFEAKRPAYKPKTLPIRI